MARTLGGGRMIEQTSVQISAQRERWQAERELRYARRNRIRHIDRLLDELEMLNIAEETQLPADLAVSGRCRNCPCLAHPWRLRHDAWRQARSSTDRHR